MKHQFMSVLIFFVSVECINSYNDRYLSLDDSKYNEILAIQRLNLIRMGQFNYGYLPDDDPQYYEKLEIQRKNLIRVDAAFADIRTNPQRPSLTDHLHFSGQLNQLDLTKPDALDGISYFTKNSLYRYRVNKSAVKSVKSQIKHVRGKWLSIFDSSVDTMFKSRKKFMNIIGTSWRRSYIIPKSDDLNRPEVTFS